VSEGDLGQLQQVLSRIGELTAVGRQRFDEEDVIRLSIERLWVYAGNLAERHRLDLGLGVGIEPWSELYAYRNLLAHARPGQVPSQRLWQETTLDLPRLSEAVRTAGQR
jgi:uncharacterized protein with HEPN domain